MGWKQIAKGSAGIPGPGTYRAWKVLLSAEGFHQCVYCTIEEASFGGLRNFHVEHLRPKSLFPHLENDFGNLFFACAICNAFKGNDWPNEPSVGRDVAAYPDPAQCNYGEFIDLDPGTSELRGITVEMRYVIERLYLNRPQLLISRRVETALVLLNDHRAYLRGMLNSINDVKLLQRIVLKLDDLIELHLELRRALPYGAGDVARA